MRYKCFWESFAPLNMCVFPGLLLALLTLAGLNLIVYTSRCFTGIQALSQTTGELYRKPNNIASPPFCFQTPSTIGPLYGILPCGSRKNKVSKKTTFFLSHRKPNIAYLRLHASSTHLGSQENEDDDFDDLSNEDSAFPPSSMQNSKHFFELPLSLPRNPIYSQTTSLSNSSSATECRNQYFDTIVRLSPNEMISRFVKATPKRVQEAAKGTIMSLIGTLPKFALETTVLTTGEKLANLMFQLQLTGYMLKNAEYRLSLMDCMRDNHEQKGEGNFASVDTSYKANLDDGMQQNVVTRIEDSSEHIVKEEETNYYEKEKTNDSESKVQEVKGDSVIGLENNRIESEKSNDSGDPVPKNVNVNKRKKEDVLSNNSLKIEKISSFSPNSAIPNDSVPFDQISNKAESFVEIHVSKPIKESLEKHSEDASSSFENIDENSLRIDTEKNQLDLSVCDESNSRSDSLPSKEGLSNKSVLKHFSDDETSLNSKTVKTEKDTFDGNILNGKNFGVDEPSEMPSHNKYSEDVIPEKAENIFLTPFEAGKHFQKPTDNSKNLIGCLISDSLYNDDAPIDSCTPNLNGLISIKLKDGSMLNMDAVLFFDEFKKRIHFLKQKIDSLRSFEKSSAHEDILKYLRLSREPQVRSLTENISENILSTMKKITNIVVEGLGALKDSGSEAITQQTGSAIAQLCMWQLAVGYNLRELEVRDDLRRSFENS